MPSGLFFDFDEVVKVGRFARDMKAQGADLRVLYNTKIDMGKKEIEYHNGYTPVKAATEILKCCYDTIRQIMPRGSEFPEVTITVPASFNQDQIADTKKAAEAADSRKFQYLKNLWRHFLIILIHRLLVVAVILIFQKEVPFGLQYRRHLRCLRCRFAN